jgi:hypothetical protein
MIDSVTILRNLPSGLREPLLSAYGEIARNFAEHRWEPAELNGGKLCEIVYSIVEGAISGTFPSAPLKPSQLANACRAIEQRPSNPALAGDRSLRILIPRLLPYLYEIRNNRGVGHVGGDVSPNFCDATAVYSCANWIMAELVRIFHGVSLCEAQSVVDALVERRLAVVWEVEGVKRVLDPSMGKSDQVLILLYSSHDWLGEDELRSWIEYKNRTEFRKLVLRPQHRRRLIEYQEAMARLRLTPLGVKDVEERILPKYKI